jgi:hypothetical protein
MTSRGENNRSGNVRFWHLADIPAALALSAFDPQRTLAVHCGNGFDAGFSPYRSTRLSR